MSTTATEIPTDVLSILSSEMPKKQPSFVPLVCTPSTTLDHVNDLLNCASTCSQKSNHAIVANAYAPLKLPPLAEMVGTSTEMKVNITIDKAKRRVKLPWKCRLLPDRVKDTLVDMAYSHASVTKADKIEGKVALVYGTPCPKWHVDRVDLRATCTLFGPGTVIQPCPCENGEGEGEDGKKEKLGDFDHKEVGTGDVVFMKGLSLGDSNRASAVVHRSPIVPPTELMPRLVVQTDSIKEDDGYM